MIDEVRKKAVFNEILDKKKITPVYQPIVSLTDGSVYGYESLTRIDMKKCPISTEELFAMAEKENCIWELEEMCRKKALKRLKNKKPFGKLFINVAPNVIYDSKFETGTTFGYLNKYNIEAEDIVFEITERTNSTNEAIFTDTIEHYKSQGYKIAVDDFGSAYAGLCRVCQLKPHFIKIDMDIVRDVDKDPFKQALVKSIALFGKESGVKIIAEGIETAGELRTLINMGIDYGQGYYIGRPGKELTEPSEIFLEKLSQSF